MAGLPDDTRPEPIDLLAELMADQRDRTERGAVLGARDDIDQAMTANYRLTGDAMTEQQTDRERYGTEGWIDRAGDVWRIGEDGLLHTAETKPFPAVFVERKWGPLRKAKEMK